MPPTSTAPPTIAGTARQGQTLTVVHGSWTNSPTAYTYQWLQCGALGGGCLPIPAATGSTYVPSASDVGHTLEVQESASNQGGVGGPATSRATETVLALAAPMSSLAPAITGQAQQGQTLNAQVGSWTNQPTSFAYQWQRCDSAGAVCSPVLAATAPSYTLGGADVGFTMRVAVSAANLGGTSAPAMSAQSAVVTPAATTFGKGGVGAFSDSFAAERKRVSRYPLNTAGSVGSLSIYLAPTTTPGQQVLKGVIYADSSGAPGALLEATEQLTFASSSPAGWYEMGFPAPLKLAPGSYWIGVISGASSGVAGFRYDSVSGSRSYNANAYSSGPSNPFGAFTVDSEQASLYATYTTLSSPPPPANTALPSISGAVAQGQLVSEVHGSWTNNPSAYAYQWLQCDSGGNNCVEIAGATGQTYAPVAADAGHSLRVQETASNTAGASSPATSGATVPVGAPPPTEPPPPPTEPPPPPSTGSATGEVRFQKNAASSFDVFDETNAFAEWINAHFYRMLVYSPYFDGRTSWYKRGLVYDDSYAIYVGESLTTTHPEWILRDKEGNKLHILGEAAEYAADISDPLWRSYFISTLKATLARGSYAGTFLDDVNMWADVGTAGGEKRVAINYRGEELTDETWRAFMAKFMEEIRAALPGYEIAQNMVWFHGASSGPGPQNPYTKSAIQQASRVEIERGVNDAGLTGGSGTFSLSSLFRYVDEVHALGPGIIMAGGDETVPGMEYNLAAYFLVNNGNDEVVGGGKSQTPLNFWTGFVVNLGEAEGARTRSSEGLFERKFTHGLVYLNEPGAGSKVITLPTEMLNTAGERVKSVTLAAKSAAILRD